MSDWLFIPSTPTSNGCGSRPALPTVMRAAAVREARDAAGEDLAADRVDDEIDAAPAGDRAHLVDPVVVRVVHAVVEPELLQTRSSRSSLDAVAITVAPARFASWIAAMPTPPAPAWISTVSPGLQVTELEQAVVRGAERDRHARDRDDVGTVGHRPGDDRGYRDAAPRASPRGRS